jgi:type IV pilus assembly protein PilC
MLDLLPIIFRRKSHIDSLSFYMRQFAAMLTAGIDPTEALGILEEEKKQKVTKGWEYLTQFPILKGRGERSVFGKSPPWFKNLLAYTMANGRVEKEAAQLLHHIADGQETLENLKKRLKAALTYPVTVMTIVAVILGVILVFVTPTFVEMYGSFADSLPGPTLTVIHCSNVVAGNFQWIIILLVLVITLLRMKVIRDFVVYILSLTGAGYPIHLYSNIMFSRTLSIMLYLKAPLDKALAAAIEAVPNRFHARRFRRALSDLEDSESLSDALESTGLYSPVTIRIFKAGEACGAVESSLAEMARYQEKDLVSHFDGLTKNLDMVLLILMATVIGFIVIALYLPIFEMGSVIG